jgi:predicted metal-dependent enzyme (double-stranded beta helix superfamily)
VIEVAEHPHPTVRQLAQRLDAALTGPAAEFATRLNDALHLSVASRDWLPPAQMTPDDRQYARHVVYADPEGRYTVVAIVWAKGQCSPVHSHHTWCGVAVYRGIIEETFFRGPDSANPPAPVNTITRNVGSLSLDLQGHGIHQIANRSQDVAVSIHIYGVAEGGISSRVNRVYA